MINYLPSIAYAQNNVSPWPPGPGSPLVPQVPNAELTQILNQIDPARIQATIQKLVSFGTRHTLSNQTDPARGIGAARDWIASQMGTFAAASNGRMTVSVPSFIQQPVSGLVLKATNISNIVATLTGTSEPNRVYVVSGHYDSRVSSILNFMDDAPGADDDASGVAVSMELARVMATHNSAATIMFAVVAGEEQDLFGSNFMATTLKQQGKDVQGMLNNDIVGSSTADDGTVDPNDIRMFVSGLPPSNTAAQNLNLASIGGENDSPAHQLGRFVAEVSQNSVTQMNGLSLLDCQQTSTKRRYSACHLSSWPLSTRRRPRIVPSPRFPCSTIHRAPWKLCPSASRRARIQRSSIRWSYRIRRLQLYRTCGQS